MALNNYITHSILHIASGDLWAGAEVQLFTLAKTLHDNFDVPVVVILLNHGMLEQKLEKAGITVKVLDESSMNDLQILRSLVKSIKELKPGIIHTHRIKENTLGSVAALLSGHIPSLRTVHGAPEHRSSWRQPLKYINHTLDWLAGRILQRRIIAVSEDLSQILERSFPAAKIRTIVNGLDVESIRCQIIDPGRVTKSHPDTIKVGLAGRLVPIKRVDLFIQTALYLHDHYPEFKTSFHIYGDGPMRNDLENLSKKLGVDGIVHFEGHCDDIPQKLQGLDALLMTSDHEGLPMILLEAMALQVPIVAHAVGGIPRLLDDGACGRLVKEQNVRAYASEILELHRSPQTFSDLSDKALKRVQSTYSTERNARAYLRNYSEIVQGSL